LINRQKTNYGKNNISKIIQNKFGDITLQQAKDLISQLVERGYLKETNIGFNFAMIIIELTDKGRGAINKNEAITLDFQRFYETFKPASEVGIVDKNIIDEYYKIKCELTILQTREEELKNTIKTTMTEKNVPELRSEFIDFFCKKIERVTYPKEKVEKFVPDDILANIRTVNQTIILTTRLKKREGPANDKNTSVED